MPTLDQVLGFVQTLATGASPQDAAFIANIRRGLGAQESERAKTLSAYSAITGQIPQEITTTRGPVGGLLQNIGVLGPPTPRPLQGSELTGALEGLAKFRDRQQQELMNKAEIAYRNALTEYEKALPEIRARELGVQEKQVGISGRQLKERHIENILARKEERRARRSERLRLMTTMEQKRRQREADVFARELAGATVSYDEEIAALQNQIDTLTKSAQVSTEDVNKMYKDLQDLVKRKSRELRKVYARHGVPIPKEEPIEKVAGKQERVLPPNIFAGPHLGALH